MSKIQDALKKMRTVSARDGSLGAVVDVGETKTLATISEHPVEIHESAPTVVPRKTVFVDRALLLQEGFLAPEDQEREFADQYRAIKRPLLENAFGRESDSLEFGNLIMIASALPGDGKTFVGINLALSMSTERDTSVLLVDADVAKPHVGHLFAVDNEPGLIDVLTDKNLSYEDVIVATDVPGLSIIPAGQKNDQSTELLASRRMARMLADLSTSDPNRVVIFDSPPLLSASEASVLASRMGQIALVVRANHTPQLALMDALENLDLEKPVNVVLNQVGVSGHGPGYGYGGYGHAAYK